MAHDIAALLPPIDVVTCPMVNTQAAAFYLGRSKKTLLNWSAAKSGPINPVRINGRLSWPVSEILKAIGHTEANHNGGHHGDN